MPAHQSRHVSLAGVTATGRRQALAGLLAGAAATLHDRAGESEAKKKKKKCKRPNLCPQRTCCTCRDPNTFIVVLCDYIAASASFIADCASFCGSHGLDPYQATGTVAEQANFCTHNLECVRLDCPVT